MSNIHAECHLIVVNGKTLSKSSGDLDLLVHSCRKSARYDHVLCYA